MKRIKNIIKLSCYLISLMLLFSCSGGKQDTSTQKNAAPSDPIAPKPMMLIAGGNAKCTIVKPTGCSEAITEAIEYFARKVKKQTGVALPIVDETEAVGTDYEITVNATYGRSEVAEQLNDTAYTDYKISTQGQRILITARSEKAVSAALKMLLNSLEGIGDGYGIKERINTDASVTLGKKKNSVPVYETEGGTELPIYSVGDGYEVLIQNTTANEFLAYAAKLEANGFVKYSESVIPSGSASVENNLSQVYISEDIHVFITWNASQQAARVVYTEPTALPALEKPILTAADTARTGLAQLGIAGLGMSYVIQLKDYSFIVIDGGTNADGNVSMLYHYLQDNTPVGQKPRIACWIFTHPDPDHIGAPAKLLTDHGNDIVLDAVAYNFPDCTIQNTVQNDEAIVSSIMELEGIVKRCSDAKIYSIHTGQRFYFKGVEMEILFTEEDTYPLTVKCYNDTSFMMRFTFDNGTTFTVLADSTEQTSKLLAATYGDYLKSDILQLAHHGLIGGDKQLYEYIDPEYCFWATSKERYEGKYDTNKDGTVNEKDIQHCLGQGGCSYNAYIRDDSIRKRIHYHAGETTVIYIE